MKLEYIKISDSNFNKVFDFPISEREYVLGGISISQNGEELGSTIIYKNPHLVSPHDNALLFGYFKASGENIANQLIQKIEEVAAKNEFKKIIGPINGSTWFNYRLLDSHENQTFLGEEITPIEYNDYLVSNGFQILKSYASYIGSSANFSEEFIAGKEAEFKQLNWKVRSLDIEDLDNELFELAQFSNRAFSSNFLFSPIVESNFIAKYSPLMKSLSSEYIWLIENQKGEIQALMLAYENSFNTKELVLKTTARTPDCEIKGLGTFLTHKITQQAKNNGLDSVIHAYLSSDDAAFISTLEFDTVAFRKYHLYYKDVVKNTK